MTKTSEIARPKRLRAKVDLDALIFDGDRDIRAALLRDQAFNQLVEATAPAAAVSSARRDLLLSSLKLSPRIAPELFQAIDRAREGLGLDADIEAYCISDPRMNAFVAPPEHGRVLLGLSSTALERMDAGELTFVVGHELGHVLLQHFQLAPEVLVDQNDDLSPLRVVQLYAWMRYAELSADRVGLLCCRDVDTAVRAFFKITSGLCDARFLKNAADSAAQLRELPEGALESSEEDWFSTHPYGPLRIKAIDLFARSESYHSLIGRVGGDLTEADLEKEVQAIMALMDPSFVREDSPYHDETREFLALGGVYVALADGEVERSEEVVLQRLLGDGSFGISPDGFKKSETRLAELGHHLALRLSPARRKRIVEDLAAIALADEKLDDAEVAALGECAAVLGLHPYFVEEALARITSSLD
jgi:uncharacterized tellurite resistance protein B-like protein